MTALLLLCFALANKISWYFSLLYQLNFSAYFAGSVAKKIFNLLASSFGL